jgi:hypothetical protein
VMRTALSRLGPVATHSDYHSGGQYSLKG